MMQVGSLRSTSDIFLQYVRKIHAKNSPEDPVYLRISIACCKLEQFIESIFPKTPMPKMIAGTAQARRQIAKAKEADGKGEAFVIVGTVAAMLILLGGLMVGVCHAFF